MEDGMNLLSNWRKRARQTQKAHFDSAAFCTFWHFLLGALVVCIATVAGSAPVTHFLDTNEVATITIVAAVLAALQTFLRLPERAEKHRVVGTGLSAIKKKIEQLKVFVKENELEKEIDSLRLEWNRLLQDAPTAVRLAWRKHTDGNEY